MPLFFPSSHFFLLQIGSNSETSYPRICSKSKREFIFIRSFSLYYCASPCVCTIPAVKHFFQSENYIFILIVCAQPVPILCCYFGGKLVVLNNWSSMNVYICLVRTPYKSAIIRGVQSKLFESILCCVGGGWRKYVLMSG